MANYKIIGSDQKQYGPVSAEDLRQWIADGRLNAQTQVQIEGADEWKSLSEVPELAEALQESACRPCRRPPAAVPAKTSGLAVTSLVLGVLGLFTCGITALFGLILGIIAMVKVSNSRGALRGGGIALAGRHRVRNLSVHDSDFCRHAAAGAGGGQAKGPGHQLRQQRETTGPGGAEFIPTTTQIIFHPPQRGATPSKPASARKQFSNVLPPIPPAAAIMPSTPNSTAWTKAKLIRRP